MSFLLVVPVIDREFSLPCLDSVHRDLREQLFVVDNTTCGLRWSGATSYRFRHNLGVARSWNLGIRIARERGHSHVVFVSAQVRFGRAGGRDLEACCEIPVGCLPPPTYWHTAVFALDTFDRVGLFDEHFYPAYFEDADFNRRMTIAGLHLPHGPEIDATAERDGHGVDRLREDFNGCRTINYEALEGYWRSKWGCSVHEQWDLDVGYRTPFGRDVDVDYWEPVEIPALRRRYRIVGR